MATTDQIILQIRADTDKALAQLKKINKELGSTEKQSKKNAKSSSMLSGALGKMAISAASLAAAYKAVIEPAIELEESQSRFDTLFRENIDSANDVSRCY